MDLNYQLTEKDVNMNLLTRDEKKMLKERLHSRMRNYGTEYGYESKNKFNRECVQKMYWEALAITIPKMGKGQDNGTENKPVILNAENVHSIMLTAKEKEKLEQDFQQAQHTLVEHLEKPMLMEYHEKMDKLYDELAIQAGFSQFEENEEGTGLRNFTAQGKRKTEDIKEKINKFNELFKNSPETKAIRDKFHAIQEGVFRLNKEMTQVYLRNILALTNSRLTLQDVKGQPILKPEQYLEKVAECTEEEKKEMDRPYTQQAKVGADGIYKTIEVDYSIAPFIDKLCEAGYVTGQSCSGLLADHPNYRYVEDGKNRNYVKGECINLNKQGSGTYISFWKPETGWNDDKKIEDVKRIAKEQGWVVEEMPIFGLPSVRLGLPYTYDGKGKREILHESNDWVNRYHPLLERDNFLEFLDKRNAHLPEVEMKHGGLVRWTDEMIIDKWKALTVALCEARKQEIEESNKLLERITDVCVYSGGDGSTRIKCRIDGVSMLSEKLADKDRKLLNNGMDVRKVAAQYYRDTLDNGEKQGKSMGR